MSSFPVPMASAGPSNQRLWLRRCQLTIGTSGKSYDLSKLRVQFRVASKTVQTLKSAEITIYNPAPETAQAILKQPEFAQVSLSAGYQSGPFSPIFSGKIAYVRWGKEDAVTSFVTIIATDSDAAYNWATINTTLPAGAKPQDQRDAILSALKPYGITLMQNPPPLPATQLTRSKAMYGMVRDALTDFANSIGCYWHFANGVLNFVAKDAPLAGDVIVLTPQTGLLGAPEQTLDGLNVRALLNPNIVTGRLIKVNAPLVNQGAFSDPRLVPQPSYSSVPYQPGLSANGVYTVYSLVHEGDNRGTGNDWQTRMIAVATASNTPPLTPTFINAVVDGT